MPHAAPPATPANRLGTSTSPYLLQHAGNPVEWYPWGEAAFAAARSAGKPVLLSIGYSACHWCHVMAHESFEDPSTAAVMNALFINIKVDREERPDIDRIYQLAHQLLTRRGGGWPLTMFLTHDDQRPFFGGTYFPPVARGGMPAFADLLARVAEYYRDQGAAMRAQSDALVAALASIDAPAAAAQRLDDAPLLLLRQQLEQRFDREHGGFTPAPKFPHAGMVSRLLRDWHATSLTEQPDLNALFMATLTLHRMAAGGLYDQLGGGFFRYSVDARWEIPHFEKMLYDNAMLLSVYAEAATATGDASFARVVRGTADFLLDELRDQGGALCSSFDADSQGHEGRYYVWNLQQVEALLAAPDATLFATRHGLDLAANFDGSWHLRAARELADVAGTADPDAIDVLSLRLDAARVQLLAARRQRVPPARDDKILTSWNALAIHGLADAARALGDPRLAHAAATVLAYLRRHHWRDGRLLAVSRGGSAQLPAYLDDHAFLIDAILALATVQFDAGALQFAAQLADCLLEHFEDREHGGFYFTADDHETLIHRSRSFSDEATPSGNAIAISALQKLGWLLAEPRYLDAAERALRAAWVQLAATPLALTQLATSLEERLQAHSFVILRGEPDEIGRWQRRLQAVWRPLVSIIAIPADASDLPPALKEKPPRGAAVAYLCRGSTCAAPLTALAAVEAALHSAPAG